MSRTRPKIQSLVRSINRDDQGAVEEALRQLAHSHRALAPLAFLVGALMMLLLGLRLVITNWRLLLLQVLPAMWLWAGMLDLKAHLFRGRSFTYWYGSSAILLMSGIVIVTIACYCLNVVFAFAVASRGEPRIKPAVTRAREHAGKSVLLGLFIGVALAVAVVISPRWGLGWFSLMLSAVLAVMMVTYLAFPARLIGARSQAPRRDKLVAAAVSGAVATAICTPAYATGRVGVQLLGSHPMYVIGVILICVGFSLQAGANGAIKAVKMSANLAVSAGEPPLSTDRSTPTAV